MEWKANIDVIVCKRENKNPILIPANTLHRDEQKKMLNFYLDPDNNNPDNNATIDEVAVYQTPLEADSIMRKVLIMTKPGYHAYVFLKVKDRYISLDKNSDGLTIQVSNERHDVVSRFNEELRNGVPKRLLQTRGV